MASHTSWADESAALNDLSTQDAFPSSAVPTPLLSISTSPPAKSHYPPKNDFRHQSSDDLAKTSHCSNDGGWASGRPSSHNFMRSNAHRSSHYENYPALKANISFEPPSHFDKFLLLKFDKSVKLDNMHLGALFDGITSYAGGPLRNMYRNNNHSYILETTSSRQTENLLSVTCIAGHTVQVSVFTALNQCKGIVNCSELNATPEDDIKARLADQGVTYVRRIKRWENHVLVPTHSYVFTFNLSYLPAAVKIYHLYLPLRTYIDNPRKCPQCQRYGHSKKNCNNDAICYKCSMALSDTTHTTPCVRPPRCYHCRDKHPTSFKGCPEYKRQEKILHVSALDHVTLYEAAKRVRASGLFSHKSFAAVAKAAEAKNAGGQSKHPTSKERVTAAAADQLDEMQESSQQIPSYTIPKSTAQHSQDYSSPLDSPKRLQKSPSRVYFSPALNSKVVINDKDDNEPMLHGSISNSQQAAPTSEVKRKNSLSVSPVKSATIETVTVEVHHASGSLNKRKAPSDTLSSQSPDAKRSSNDPSTVTNVAPVSHPQDHYDDFVGAVSQDYSLGDVFDSSGDTVHGLQAAPGNDPKTTSILNMQWPPGYSKEQILLLASQVSTNSGSNSKSSIHTNSSSVHKDLYKSHAPGLSKKPPRNLSGSTWKSSGAALSQNGVKKNPPIKPPVKRTDPRVTGKPIPSIANIQSTKK